MRNVWGWLTALFIVTAMITAVPIAEAKPNKPTHGNTPAKPAKPTQGNKPTIMKVTLTAATGYATVEGKAFFSTSAKEQRFRVQLEGLPTPSPSLEVFIGTTKIGTMKVEGDEAKLDLRLRKGGKPPAVTVGDTVQVKTTDGTLVASGTF